TLLGTYTVNQINAPVGTTVNGSVFQSLGSFSISSGTIRVVTSNSTSGGSYVTADAVLFKPTTQPPNTAPTISTVANQTITAGQSTGALAFTVGDTEDAVSALTVTASSSNTGLVSSSGIVFGGSGANRTVTITPISGQTGSATITLTVTDGGGLTATST